MPDTGVVEREVRHYTVNTPAGTPIASPQVFPLVMPPRRVHLIQWRVPAGAAGLMGWRLTMGGVQVLPTPGTDLWVIAAGESGSWNIEEFPDSGAWQVTSYNTGTFTHALYLAFHVDHAGRRDQPQLTLAELDPDQVGAS